jgi:hypothetical protein
MIDVMSIGVYCAAKKGRYCCASELQQWGLRKQWPNAAGLVIEQLTSFEVVIRSEEGYSHRDFTRTRQVSLGRHFVVIQRVPT